MSKIDRSERWIFNDVNFIYHDPKKEDMAPEQATYLKDYVDGFEAVLFGDDFDDLQTGYRSYVRITSYNVCYTKLLRITQPRKLIFIWAD